MYGYRTASRRIVGHLEQAVTGQFHISVIAGNEQVSLRIVAAGGTDNVHKRLVDLIDQIIGVRLALGAAPAVPKAFPAQFFILRFKNQIVAVVGECIADLCPDPLVLLHAVFLVRGEVRQPAAVIVQIENDIQSAVYCPVHHFLHRRKVLVADGVVILHHIRPRHRYTEGVKAGICVTLDHLLGNHRTAPRGFIGFRCAVPPLGDPVAARFVGVSQIDANAHVLDQLGSGDVPHGGLLLGQSRHRSGAAAPENTGSHCSGNYFFHHYDFLAVHAAGVSPVRVVLCRSCHTHLYTPLLAEVRGCAAAVLLELA